MNKHSKLPPSSAARRVACPGSRRLEERYPEKEPSVYSREGEAAHWLAGTVLCCGYLPKTVDAFKSPSGELITEEMIDGANVYLASIESVTKQFGCPQLHIEQTIDISSIHEECWGTPDAWVIHNNELHLWDYKFGHSFIEVFENWQLIEYAAGILQIQEAKKVHFYIIQPRSFHKEGQVRKWSIDRERLQVYFERLKAHESLAIQDSVFCKPNPECNFCKARHVCETLQTASLMAVDIAKQNISNELDETQLGYELTTLKRHADLLEARITGLEEQAKYLIKRGKRVALFKMESVSSREVWTKPAEEIISLGLLLDQNLSKPPATVTPAQARKMGVDEKILSAYTERQQGSLKLVAEKIKDSHKIFGNHTNE